MSSIRFVPGLAAPDFGDGAPFLVWAMRACVNGRAKCCDLMRGFEKEFGTEGGSVLGDLINIIKTLKDGARQPLRFAGPADPRITYDEAVLLSAIAAAQSCDFRRSIDHLLWVADLRATRQALVALAKTAAVFQTHQLAIQTPAARKRMRSVLVQARSESEDSLQRSPFRSQN